MSLKKAPPLPPNSFFDQRPPNCTHPKRLLKHSKQGSVPTHHKTGVEPLEKTWWWWKLNGRANFHAFFPRQCLQGGG